MSAAPWRLHTHDSLPSTQDACRALAEAGEPGRVAVRAERQTHGRGTQGRGWMSPPGNLSLSVLLRPATAAAGSGQWGLLAAVALAEAVAAALPATVRPTLKWPNDVLVAGAKLGGILVEAAARPDAGLEWLVIGFGVNLASAPDVPGRAVTAVALHAPAPQPAAFAAALLERLDHWDALRRGHGFVPVRSAWLAHGPAIGTGLQLRRAEATVTGRFAGLGEDGTLLLDSGGAVRAFASGEVGEAAPCCS